MDFYIQAGTPRSSHERDESDHSLDEAIESAFPLRTEYAYLVWQGVHIPLGYKYDLSVMSADLMEIVEKLLSSSEGRHEIHWASNSFASIWLLKWFGDELKIESTWSQVIGGTESILSERSNICVGRLEFVREWREVFGKLLGGLDDAGYDENSIPEMAKMRFLFQTIDRSGSLYYIDPV